MTLETVLAQPVVTRLGWALVHFVWQGALVGGAAAVALRAMRRSSANARYLAACAALAVMAALPVYTFIALKIETAPATATATTSFTQGAVGEDATRGSGHGDSQAQPAALSQRESQTAGGGAGSSSVEDDGPWYAAYGLGQLALIVGRFAPWLAIAWAACVLALSARFLGGWARVRRMSVGAVELAEAEFRERCQRMRERVKVTRAVQFLRSAVAEVPMVIGWMKPVVLLPVSVMTNLPAEQLEAIIAHELAHVRRYDYLVNLMQTAVETLLFYHPAVWWVSRRIRAEREHAADDAATEACGSRLIYAKALAGLEEARRGHGRLAVAASGGTLMERIRRIMGAPSAREPRATGWLGGAIAITLVALAFACALPSREAAKDRFPAGGKSANGEAQSSDAGQSSTQSLVRRWTHEGQFELDKKLLIRLAAGTRAEPTVVRVNYAQFAVVDGQLTAYVRYYNVTAADAKFRIGVAITDQAGNVLGRDEAVIESQYESAYMPLMSDNVIALIIGGRKDIPAARQFQLYVEQAGDDATVNAKFVDIGSLTGKDRDAAKGSLTLEVEAVSADGARVEYPVLFQLWRRTEHPRELDGWFQRYFKQTWEDGSSNAVWEPAGSTQSGSPMRWTDLASGQYLVTAAQASSVTGAQVHFGPMGASGAIVLDGSTAVTTSQVELKGDATLLVKTVDEATGKPVDSVALNILRADGLPLVVTRMERGGEGETRCGYLRPGKYYIEAHKGYWWDTIEYFANEKAAVEVEAGKENVLTVRLEAVKHSFEPTSGGDAKEAERGAVPAGRTVLHEAAKGAYVATLPNGIRVEIVGVSRHPSKDQRWWEPGGSAIIEAPYDCPNISSSITGYQAREAAVRISGQGADSAAFTSGPGGGSWPAERDGKKIGGMIGLVAHFRNGEKTGTLRVGVAAGPWRTVQPLEKAKIGAAVGPEGEFHYSITARPNDGVTVAVVTNRGRNEDLRVVAVDMTGQLREGRRSIDMAGDMLQVVTEFSGISFDDVRQLQYQVRPYEWVEFKDIALDPKAGEAAELGTLPAGQTALHDAANGGQGEPAQGKADNAQETERLLAQLSGGDPWLREMAVRGLVQIGSERAADGLIAALADKEVIIRFRAAEGLGQLRCARAVSELAAVLVKDADGNVRREAASALREIGDARAVEGLIAALSDSDSGVRNEAIITLASLGDARAVEPLIARMKVEGNTDLLAQLAGALGSLGDRRAVEPLVEILASRDEWVRLLAAVGLGKIGDAKAVEPLIAALGDPDGMVRTAAAEALGKIGDRRAVEPLIAALKDPAGSHATKVASALGQLGDARAIEPLTAAAGDKPNPQMAGALEDLWLRTSRGLGKLSTADISVLREALKDYDSGIRKAAIRALGEIGGADSIDAIASAVGDQDTSVRYEAAKALAMAHDARGIEPLAGALKDTEAPVRSEAARMLGEIKDPRVAKPLLLALGDPTIGAWDFPTVTLASVADARTVDALIAMLKDDRSVVASRAAAVLREMGDPRATEALIAVLKDTQSPIHWDAVSALGRIPGDRATEGLVLALGDLSGAPGGTWGPSGGIRGAAAAELAERAWKPQTRTEEIRYLVASERWDAAARIAPSAEQDPQGGNAAGGRIEFDVPILAKLKEAGAETLWIEFQRVNDHLYAVLSFTYPSWPADKWRAGVTVQDSKGNDLKKAEATLSNEPASISSIVYQFGGGRCFDLGALADLEGAARFSLSLGRDTEPRSANATGEGAVGAPAKSERVESTDAALKAKAGETEPSAQAPSAQEPAKTPGQAVESVHTATVTADDMQRRGEEMLGRMAEACSYWLIRPPKTVKTYSYDFTLGDNEVQHFEIEDAAGAGDSRRQGITYYSPLHAIARNPKLAHFSKIELVRNETIEIDFILDEPLSQHFGTGVENTWRGYMSQGARGGTIVLDAKRFVPLSCKTGDVEQTFSEYVDAGALHYVPRRITVVEHGHSGMQWDWRFKLYEGGLWLFDQTGNKSQAQAAVSNVIVNGQPAHEETAGGTGAASEAVPAKQTGAVTRIVTEGRTKAEAVIAANRAWLMPPLAAREGLVYEYRQEEPYLEKVMFDENGNVMAELESTKESPGKATRQAFFGIDGTKAWASAEEEFVRTERTAGPETATGEERMHCERMVNNLATGLGFDSGVTRMARGLDDYYAEVSDAGDKGSFKLVVTWPGRGTSLFTGTMLAFSSWAYMHDVGYAKSEIVCDSATMRPVEEKDYDGEGKLVGAYTYADYLDDAEGAAPGRITAVIPYEADGKDNSLEMDASFEFARPGVWLLKSVTSKFRGSEGGSTGGVTVVPATAESTAPMLTMLKRIKATSDMMKGVEEAREGKAEAPFDADGWSSIGVRAANPENITSIDGTKPVITAIAIHGAKWGTDKVASTVTLVSTAYWMEYEVAVKVEYLSEKGEVLGEGTSTPIIRAEGAPRVMQVKMGDTAVFGGPVTGGPDAVKRVAVSAVVRRMTAMYHGHGMWMTFVEPAKKEEAGSAAKDAEGGATGK